VFPVLSLTKLIFKCIDDIFDRAAERLADNFLENSETIEQNRQAREQQQAIHQRVTAKRTTVLTPAIFMA